MRALELNRGMVTVVDDDVFNEVAQYRWKCTSKGYAARYKWEGGKVYIIYMHREIMKAEKGMEVDHRNLQKLDNRRENLRVCTRAENARNCTKNIKNTSGFKGVFFEKKKQAWRARIRCGDGKRIHLGFFSTPEDASLAYNAAAIRLHGEFANIN